MTLILGLLTQRYVLLVSDRRLVKPLGNGAYKVHDDDRTKLLTVGTSAMFGYTGLSKIDGQRTHEWFAGFMKPFVDARETGDGLRKVRRELTRRFKVPRIRLMPGCKRRHAFLGVAFKRSESRGAVYAAADLITNFHDVNWGELSTAQDEFVMRSLLLEPGSRLRLLAIGALPTEPGRLRDLTRYLRRRRFLESPQYAARVLAHEVRRVSDFYGEYGLVGKGLLICCIPRQYALHGGIPGGPFDMETLSTVYVPVSGTSQMSIIPAMAIAGFPALISDVTWSIPPPVDGSDPYAEWRHELLLPTTVFDRHLP